MSTEFFANVTGVLRLTAYQAQILDDRPACCVCEQIEAWYPQLDLETISEIDASIEELIMPRPYRGTMRYMPTKIDCGKLSEYQKLALLDRFLGSTWCAQRSPFSLGGQTPAESLEYARAKRSVDKLATRYREAGFTINSRDVPFE